MFADNVLTAGGGAQADGGGLPDLIGALYSYLHEIDGLRDVCLRCERTAMVQEHLSRLRVLRFYAYRDETMIHLRSAVNQLSDRLRRDRNRSQNAVSAASISRIPVDCSSVVRERIVWENRPALVEVAAADPDSTRLRVSLLFPTLEGDVRELPLRSLADALRCHEFLVPAAVAAPLQVEPDEATLTIRGFLKRTMPRNLYASQWIFNPGAG